MIAIPNSAKNGATSSVSAATRSNSFQAESPMAHESGEDRVPTQFVSCGMIRVITNRETLMTYVLVHGAWHTGWHWHLVAAELQRRGHRTIAVTLPADAGASVAVQVVLDSLDGLDGAATGAVTVVGHSMGGLVAPAVAQQLTRVERVVFVAGLLPLIGSSWNAQIAAADRGTIILRGLSDGQVYHGDGSSSWVDEGKAVARLYADAPLDLARAAVARLRRQYWNVMGETCPLEAWPDVEYRSIVCTRDAVLSPAWSRQTFRDRFGVEAVELDSDHSPFLSRPDALVDQLLL